MVRYTYLRCSTEQKKEERWLERWRLCGRIVQESGGGELGELRELGE